MKYFTWNRNNSRAKIQTMIVCSFIFFISACATTFDIDEQKVLGPVSEHQKIFIVKYDTPQKWLDYNDVRDEMFSKWILNGFTELLNKNDIDADGTVLTKENKRQTKNRSN